eukprot:2027759-Pyramimonas_sp.AAC.1
MPDDVVWTGRVGDPARVPIGPGGVVRYPQRENEPLQDSPLCRKMLLRDVSLMASCEGATFQDLEGHVKKYETYPGVRGPSERPAWSRDPRPYVTLEGRRKSHKQEYIVEFQDSLVHCGWLKRADYISPEPDHRRDQGLPEFDFDPTPFSSAPLPHFNLRQRVLQEETARRVNIERKAAPSSAR